ncbi:hypothetical protein RDABS01_000041 [Bienertia sinuspersici]
MMGRPWCFDQHLLVLQEISGNEQPDDVILSHSSFWARIYNLPFNCRDDEVIKAIASKIGDIMEIEKDDLRLEKFRRVRVMMDVTKPLRRYQRIKNKEGRVVTVNYKYERLPFFCFMRGVMGHSEKDCSVADEEDNNGGCGWGTWLKASPRKGRNKEMEEVVSLMAKRKTLFINKKRSPVEVGEDETNSQNADNIGGWEANAILTKDKVGADDVREEDDKGRKCHAKEKEKVVFNKENEACMHGGTHFALMEHKGDDACGSDSQNSCNSFLFSMGSSFDQRRRPKIIKKAAGSKGISKGDKVHGSNGNYKRKNEATEMDIDVGEMAGGTKWGDKLKPVSRIQ